MDFEPKRRFSPFVVQCFVTGAISGNIISQVAALGYPAVLFPQLRQKNALITLSMEEESWIASVMALPTLVGNFLTPCIMDRMGRKAALYALTVPIILGWLFIVIATNFQMLMIGRVLQGLSYGMLMPVRSVVIGEYTSPVNRGAFLATISLSLAFGVFFVHLIGSFLNWQWTALICSFFSYISLIMTIYCPESPSYLVMKRKYHECKKAFRHLRGDIEEDELEQMIKARLVLEETEVTNMNFKEFVRILKKREFYKPVILVVHSYVLLKASGGPLFGAYAHEILTVMTGKNTDVNFWMVFSDGLRLLFSVAGIYVVRRYKRRPLLLTTGSLCVISLLCISFYIYLKTRGMLSYDATWITVLLISFFSFTMAIGMAPLPVTIAGEVFPIAHRAPAASISVISDCATIFLVLKTFSSLQLTIGLDGVYLLYAVIVIYLLLVMWIMLPETKGKTLQQIEEEFKGKPMILKEAEVLKS